MTTIPDLSKDVELERLREEVRVFSRKLIQREGESENLHLRIRDLEEAREFYGGAKVLRHNLIQGDESEGGFMMVDEDGDWVDYAYHLESVRAATGEIEVKWNKDVELLKSANARISELMGVTVERSARAINLEAKLDQMTGKLSDFSDLVDDLRIVFDRIDEGILEDESYPYEDGPGPITLDAIREICGKTLEESGVKLRQIGTTVQEPRPRVEGVSFYLDAEGRGWLEPGEGRKLVEFEQKGEIFQIAEERPTWWIRAWRRIKFWV